MEHYDDLGFKQEEQREPGVSGAPAEGTGRGWIVFMKVIAYINMVIMILAGFGGFMFFSDNYEPEMGLLVLVLAVLVSLIATAGIMVYLGIAENTRRNTNNSAKILRLLSRRKGE